MSMSMFTVNICIASLITTGTLLLLEKKRNLTLNQTGTIIGKLVPNQTLIKLLKTKNIKNGYMIYVLYTFYTISKHLNGLLTTAITDYKVI